MLYYYELRIERISSKGSVKVPLQTTVSLGIEGHNPLPFKFIPTKSQVRYASVLLF